MTFVALCVVRRAFRGRPGVVPPPFAGTIPRGRGGSRMFVIFGWRKETVEVDCALRCHCYRCQRTRAWEHWRET